MLHKIKEWYNGYTWNGSDYVYNPFSVLNFFSTGSFQDYWFKSGTPTFLIKKLYEQTYFNLNDLEASAQLFESYTLDNLDVRSLLFQTGYLTIKGIEQEFGLYHFDYPNREVEQAMHNHLIAALLHRQPAGSINPVMELREAFLNNDLPRVITVINAMLKDVPSPPAEGQKRGLLPCPGPPALPVPGAVRPERGAHFRRAHGCGCPHVGADYVLEFKIGQSAAVALEQIAEKGYAEKFVLEDKAITEVGINFDPKRRAVSDWEAVEIKK